MAASDEELARTATAPAASGATPARTGTLGRFRIEGRLGEGGMGVVYAAFDPELERRVAVKVLRHAGDADARARLLREARAMAKLSHPNAITVFEVGSADGDDYIAMELIDGETVGDWLRRAAPGWRDVLAAFLAAGRALAAAHAEGLVHRDFKPSNLLRSRSGRIVVTDFGLARVSDAGPDSAGEVAAPRSGLATRTQTGAVVGTPAYMAPEQWTGETIGPASDQFAFCVALWEALAGERPHRGDTLEALRAAVLDGEPPPTSAAIPRPLRALLLRGLAIDPARRWPSMTALLAALERVAGRRRRMIAAGAGLVVTGSLVVALLVARRGAGDGCSPPALDVAAVWSDARAAAFAARSPEAAKLVDADLASWRAARSGACTAATNVQSAQLACLDAVLERIDAVVGAAERRGTRLDGDGVGAVLVAPALCVRPAPPRLATITPELASAFDLLSRATADPPPGAAELAAVADHAATPCARVVGLLARLAAVDTSRATANPGETLRDEMTASELVATCDDDALKATLALDDTVFRSPGHLERAVAAADAFPQEHMLAGVEMLRAQQSGGSKRWDETVAHLDRAIELFGKRSLVRSQLDAVGEEVELLLARGRPEDLANIEPLVARWRPIAQRVGASAVAELDDRMVPVRWRLGDVAGAEAEAERLHTRSDSETLMLMVDKNPPVDVSGDVVDEAGAPVADATVGAAMLLVGDSARVVTPLYALAPKTVRADHAGHFTLPGVRGFVAAQSGATRSRAVGAAPHLRLVVEPTGHIEGTVTLGAMPASLLWVVARTDDALPMVEVAPVLATGRFQLDGVPRGIIHVGVTAIGDYEPGAAERVVVGREPITGIELAQPSNQLQVIARSPDVTPPDSALLWVFSGYRPIEHPTLDALMRTEVPIKTGVPATRVELARVPDALRGKVEADDLLATIAGVSDGELMVCGLGVANKQIAGEAAVADLGSELLGIELGCTRVAPHQAIVTLDIPAVRKLRPHK